MARKRSRINVSGKSNRLTARRGSNKISQKTLMVMAILVLLVNILSLGVYVYALQGSSYHIPSSQNQPMIEETPAVSGMASLQIIERPDDK